MDETELNGHHQEVRTGLQVETQEQGCLWPLGYFVCTFHIWAFFWRKAIIFIRSPNQ